MTRSIVLLSVLGGLVGCSVGEVNLNGGTTDGGNPLTDANSAACATRSTPIAAHVHDAATAGGGTKAGESCMASGCHGAPLGAGAPAFLMAGTLYKPDGMTPSAGAEIRLEPEAGGAKGIAKTDDAGNFYSTQQINPFPATTLASACPTTDRPMSGKIVTPAQGNCNGGTACHQNPGGLPMVLADQ